jgi:16S rRNA processing protein RimM
VRALDWRPHCVLGVRYDRRCCHCWASVRHHRDCLTGIVVTLSDPTPDFVPLAVIRHAHGLRGEVKVASFTTPPEQFLAYPLTDAKGNAFKLTRTGVQKGIFLCRVEGVTDRNGAEALKNRELGASRALLPALDADSTYVSDLIGCRVQDAQGANIGTVRAVVNYGASDILILDTADGELMLPYTEQFFPGDMENGILTCHMPEIVVGEERA